MNITCQENKIAAKGQVVMAICPYSQQIYWNIGVGEEGK
nr:MAG TPA: hypothetical protein [Caudoviricetes sp.]